MDEINYVSHLFMDTNEYRLVVRGSTTLLNQLLFGIPYEVFNNDVSCKKNAS